jgi:hypothetical protein
MDDIQKLLDSTFSFVEDLLKNHGEFFPLATALKLDDSIAQIATYDGNERPLSVNLISDIKNAIRAKKEDYKAIAIFYDVKAVDPDTKIKTDAIAIFVETRNDKTSFTFYYPYQLTKDKKLNFSDPWKSKIDKEIF